MSCILSCLVDIFCFLSLADEFHPAVSHMHSPHSQTLLVPLRAFGSAALKRSPAVAWTGSTDSLASQKPFLWAPICIGQAGEGAAEQAAKVPEQPFCSGNCRGEAIRQQHDTSQLPKSANHRCVICCPAARVSLCPR